MVDLHGLRALVTRPGQPGQALTEAIHAAGGTAVYFPAMRIVAVEHSDALQALARTFPSDLLAVFISPNAVIHGRDWLQKNQLWQTLIANRVAAVGSGTAQVLREAGIADVITPHAGSGAAALLERRELGSLHDTNVIIFRGVGGKEELARRLRERGALVRYAEVYRRVRPETPLTTGELAGVDIVVTSSREGLENLYALAEPDAEERLRSLPLLVSSTAAARIARAHKQRISPIITPQLNNRQILEELARWRNNPNRRATPPTAAK